MDNIVIKVENVGKKFCKSIRNSMLYGIKDVLKTSIGIKPDSSQLRPDEFWALEDISFELKRGETLGVIGPNGSGKTTLLKLLNGIFMPDKGRIEINGRVGALIELGSGFHPMLTGRENIYINGAILGMSKKEIDEKFDSIIEFADIGDFLDAPVKYYSSGMYVRLGFAIAIHCDPDILLIDEILAVGDKDFQMKCYQKMHEVRKSGVSIILISHNEYTIRETTANCLYLKEGQIRFLGNSEEGISVYIKEVFEDKAKKIVVEKVRKLESLKKARVLSLKFFDHNWNKISSIESGQELNIILECIIEEELNNPIFGVNFYDNSGFMYCVNSYYEGLDIKKCPTGKIRIKINIPQFYLPTNNYFCSTIISEENIDNLIDWENMTYSFVVERAKNARGSIKLPTKWEIEKI